VISTATAAPFFSPHSGSIEEYSPCVVYGTRAVIIDGAVYHLTISLPFVFKATFQSNYFLFDLIFLFSQQKKLPDTTRTLSTLEPRKLMKPPPLELFYIM
jgi:hypothetical protein